jgi:thiol-disulfide isomerase/thioredoxin/NAD-dependent dihydropyrimidine dehydrogenase PreA subunit
MSKILINHKICDRSPQCGGIAVCPNGALTYDEISKNVVWNQAKCTFCLKCTLPDACPVGAIMFARDDTDEKTILDTINSDPRTEDWLWLERYGVQPSPNNPIAIELTPGNISSIPTDVPVIIDIWHEDFLDCRLHSPLFSDLLKDIPSFQLYKLDAKKYPELAKRYNVSQYPSLIVVNSNNVLYSHSGYIFEEEIDKINQQLIIQNK